MHQPAVVLALATALALTLAGCSGPSPDAPLSGYAEAELVYLAPSAAGELRTLAVKRGDSVASGQLLYTLDSDAEALTRDAARARSEQAASQEADLRKGRRPLELQQLEQQLAQARATLSASTATLERHRRLVEQGFIAALQLDTLAATRDRDAARVAELQAQRAFAAEAARRDAIAAAAAGSRGAQADLALAQWREGQKQRTAPTAARVYEVMYRVGEWVPAGSPVLALLPPGAVKLRFFVPEPALPRVAVGGTVAVACDGCPSGLTARIRFISPQAEFTPPVIYSVGSRSKLVFMVEAEPIDPGALKPGQPVDVRLAKTP
ncbi:MAG: HlyD family efflux transporter periplasmic adaptor subunit [Rubrivivax sp.]|nr:HlyD family efflux transporter periplasmic adaptor subunit [Rubrivivax sp.]